MSKTNESTKKERSLLIDRYKGENEERLLIKRKTDGWVEYKQTKKP